MFASSERAPKVKKNEIAIMHNYAELCGIMRENYAELCIIMHLVVGLPSDLPSESAISLRDSASSSAGALALPQSR